jgi:4a-hydroxytetrahydrobiopterin dehydratase
VPCKQGTRPLGEPEYAPLLAQLDGWEVVDGHHLRKSYKFKNFKETLAFVNRVGGVAEAEGHHPDICFTWGRARIEVWTHSIDGLSESDFVLAAKVDRV